MQGFPREFEVLGTAVVNIVVSPVRVRISPSLPGNPDGSRGSGDWLASAARLSGALSGDEWEMIP
jgi:hypothetical protein